MTKKRNNTNNNNTFSSKRTRYEEIVNIEEKDQIEDKMEKIKIKTKTKTKMKKMMMRRKLMILKFLKEKTMKKQ